MPQRILKVDGSEWEVSPTGRVTQYGRDEFSLLFRRRSGGPAEVRVVRYAPLHVRRPEEALATLPETRLRDLFQRSQPGWTSPDTGYAR